jgi:hypothetical protein
MSNVRALPDGNTIAAQILAAFTHSVAHGNAVTGTSIRDQQETVAPAHVPPPRPYWAEQEGRPRPGSAVHEELPRPVQDEQLLADHHVQSLAFARKALGASPTLTDTLLLVCDAWPDRAEAERWRKAIAIEDYMSARDQVARAQAAPA